MQGAKLSTSLYKLYHNCLLNSIVSSTLGANIGNIRVPAPTCADDTALLAGDPYELQAMLNIVNSSTERDLVKINPDKSEILSYKHNRAVDIKLGNQPVKITRDTVHLGILRNQNNRVDIENRLGTARKTIYALLGPGLHARKGFSPVVALHIWKTFAVPRCLYGIEVQFTTNQDITKLELLQRKILKHLQGLPDRTSTVAVYSLIGAEPIETLVDKNYLSLFMNIIWSPESVEFDILRRQLAMSTDRRSSFTLIVREIIDKLKLPNINYLMANPPTKRTWKSLVKKAVATYWKEKWETERQGKTSLTYLKLQENPTNQPHNIWQSIKNRPHEVRRAEIKGRLVTGTYILQGDRAKFNNNPVSAICPLCNLENESLYHFAVKCPQLQEVRQPFMDKLEGMINGHQVNGYQNIIDRNLMLQLLLDCTHDDISMAIKPNKELYRNIERCSQKLLYSIHQKRLTILKEQALKSRQ
jgi:hypothetical protein